MSPAVSTFEMLLLLVVQTYMRTTKKSELCIETKSFEKTLLTTLSSRLTLLGELYIIFLFFL